MRRKGSAVQAWSVRVLRLAVIVALVAVMVPLGVPAASAAGVTYWVDISTGVDDGAHGTEVAPFKTITYAVSQADGTDTIMVEPGTYSEANGESMPIQIFDGETLISTGGAASTIIQGASGKMLLVVNGWSDGDRLQGFTFSDGGGGSSPGVQFNLQFASSGTNVPLITGNVFSGNNVGTGGALVVGSPNLGVATAIAVESNTFTGNLASSGGAFRYDGYGSFSLTGNTFTGNVAQLGAAVYAQTYDSACTIVDNVFEWNSSSNSGGAIWWNGNGSNQVRHTIAFNSFTNNTAIAQGGAMTLYHIPVLVDSNYAEGNLASAFGGFAYLEQGIVTAENNYLTGNSAGTGGAAWQCDNTSRLVERNDTVYAHAGTATEATRLAPGGLYSILEITNCIYWNIALTHEIVGATSVSYTCSGDDAVTLAANNTVGAGMVYASPAFHGMLGAPYLAQASPCVDAGNVANYPFEDYYGTTRALDGDGDRIDEPDIGCHEVDAVTPVIVLAPVYRFYNFTNNTHFFTDSAAEADIVIATWPNVYRYEGIAYYTNPANNTQPLYRFYNKVSSSHFYTASAGEAAHILATWPHIFVLDGQTYAVNPGPVPFSTPVYRFYNLRNGSHFFTASAAEADMVIATWPDVYNYEGPAFWIGL